jgi:hypothetical protein
MRDVIFLSPASAIQVPDGSKRSAKGRSSGSFIAMPRHSQYTCCSAKMSWRFERTPWYAQPRVAHLELLIVILGSSNVDMRIVLPAIWPEGRDFSVLEELVIGLGGIEDISPTASADTPARLAIWLSI